MFSSKQDINNDDGREETSLFDKQLYDRSLMENPSLDLMGANIQ